MKTWHLLLMAQILVTSVAFQILLKSAVGKHLGQASSFHFRFFIQYCFCTAMAIVVTLATANEFITDWAVVAIAAAGFVNGFGAYSQWKATQINQSKNALFTIFDDIIAMSLSYYVFSEGKYFNTGAITGIVLALGSVLVLFMHDIKKTNRVALSFYGYVGFYSVVWGVALFLQKYFGFKEVPLGKFLVCWYIGALLAATLINIFLRKKRKTNPDKREASLTKKNVCTIFLMAGCVVGTVAIRYEIYKLVPQTIVQPIILVTDMILPALIGLWLFKERKEFSFIQRLMFIVAFAGGIVLAANY